MPPCKYHDASNVTSLLIIQGAVNKAIPQIKIKST
jgi:hypothetical protein